MPPLWSIRDEEYFDDYRRLQDIERYVDRLVELHPDLVVLRQIGSSLQGRPLKVLEITDRTVGSPSPEDKPCIFIQGGIHAREWIAPTTVLYIANALLQRAGDAEVATLLKTFVFTVFVLVNPDGYVFSWEVDRMWRKNRRGGLGCRENGVDLNRNWGFSWAKTTSPAYSKSLHNPCTEVFIGPSAFSEPETQAPAAYMRARQKRSLQLTQTRPNKESNPGPGHVAAFLDFHSYAQILLPPWGYTAQTPLAQDGEFQTGLTASMVKAYVANSGRQFEAGADLLPADPGTAPDWAYGELGVRATMTVELEGSQGFCEIPSNIRSIGEEQFAGVKALAEYLIANGCEPSSAIGTFKSLPIAKGCESAIDGNFQELPRTSQDSVGRTSVEIPTFGKSYKPFLIVFACGLTLVCAYVFYKRKYSGRHRGGHDENYEMQKRDPPPIAFGGVE